MTPAKQLAQMYSIDTMINMLQEAADALENGTPKQVITGKKIQAFVDKFKADVIRLIVESEN